MTEIYLGEAREITLDITGGTADSVPTAIATLPDNTEVALAVTTATPPAGVSERYSATLNMAQTQYAGTIKVTWTFTMATAPVTKVDYYDVIQPLVSVEDVRNAIDVEDATDEDIILAERRVRTIIEANCGQQFAPIRGTVTVLGRGDVFIRLPFRLISADTIVNMRSGYPVFGYTLRDDGWTLTKHYDSPTDYTPLTVTGPIFDPYGYNSYLWSRGSEWTITGLWGWERVPMEIAEAALILIEQRLCDESTYRDNYLTSMKASDWRFDISPGAFIGTGNVVADQLIAKYMVSKLAVF